MHNHHSARNVHKQTNTVHSKSPGSMRNSHNTNPRQTGGTKRCVLVTRQDRSGVTLSTPAFIYQQSSRTRRAGDTWAVPCRKSRNISDRGDTPRHKRPEQQTSASSGLTARVRAPIGLPRDRPNSKLRHRQAQCRITRIWKIG